jgi:8-oxo-dGTP pyrophosphatase MutT (NUDIX family)
MDVQMYHGFPVLDAETVFPYLEKNGIVKWRHIAEPVTLDEYRAGDLTAAERAELRFAPKINVLSLENPIDNSTFRGFQYRGLSWSTVFTMLPGDLVLVVGEYKHGADEITLIPPSGTPNREEREHPDAMARCAMREYREETGLELARVVSLTNNPLLLASRQMDYRYYPFMGAVKRPIVPAPVQLDQTELNMPVLIPLEEWLKLLERGKGIDDCSLVVTYLSLYRLGRLTIRL